ncbi:hypothetical protein P43SY_000480 [Pythium insidiosum]|uniref:Kazal-like domain-containing protein n=1 Tax=Pythium insidiosum TaxID=114742 RepID=A0AAD5M396_PYTIN|nr:hypothetical protein P43SY_000480 [Pythium insidiosum]
MKIFAVLALSATALVAAANAEPAANCALGCHDIFKPVCGSNGVTYGNECEFNIAKCQMGDAGKDLTIKHQGECEQPVCNDTCPDILNPVCASNDVTYANPCEFLNAKCKLGDAGNDLFIKYGGECVLKPSASCFIMCPDVMQPVCGSDEITYKNACEFDVAKCKLDDAGKDLFIKHEGVCRREAVKAAATCNTVCADVFAPVCGSNDVTYNNDCDFGVAKCKLGDAGKDLTIKHDGECGDKAKRALRAEIGCEIGCVDEYVPVCGSDMITYRNKCELRVAQCTTKDPTLVELYEGVCRR